MHLNPSRSSKLRTFLTIIAITTGLIIRSNAFAHTRTKKFSSSGLNSNGHSRFVAGTPLMPPQSWSRYGTTYRTQRYAMVMKRVPRAKRVVSLPTESGVIPENLTRKVAAKRPSLGHVVPKAFREKAKGGSKNPVLRSQGKTREVGMNNPSNLKVLGGIARGRRLDSPDVYLRPMMGKVREAVFSTFTSFGLYDVVGDGSVTAPTRHLDIFAGSGSVGIESLSRGAAHCTFVDLARNCCDAIERNLKVCEFADQGDIKCCDVYQALSHPETVGIDGTFDIITLCPPYEEVVYADLLSAVANSSLLRDDSIVLIEYPVELGCLPHVLNRETEGNEGKLIGIRNRKYGRTVIAMYITNPTGHLEVADSRPEEFVFF